MNRFSTLLLTSILAGSLGACSDDPPAAPSDAGVPSDRGTPTDGACTATPIADPTPNMTSCSAPPVDGGPVPYFQCTSDNVCPTGRYMNNAMRPGYRLTYIKITQPAALAFASDRTQSELPRVGYASVFPIATVAKIVIAQLLLAWLT